MTENVNPDYRKVPPTDGVDATQTKFYGAMLEGVGLQSGVMVDRDRLMNSGALVVPDISYLTDLSEGRIEGEKCPPTTQLSIRYLHGKPGQRYGGRFTYWAGFGEKTTKYTGVPVSFAEGNGYHVKNDSHRKEENIMEFPIGKETNAHLQLPADVINNIHQNGSRVIASAEDYFRHQTATCLVFDRVDTLSSARFIMESTSPISFEGPTSPKSPAVRITIDGPFEEQNRRVLLPLTAFEEVLGRDPLLDERTFGDVLPPKITQLCYDAFNGRTGPFALFGGPMTPKQPRQ